MGAVALVVREGKHQHRQLDTRKFAFVLCSLLVHFFNGGGRHWHSSSCIRTLRQPGLPEVSLRPNIFTGVKYYTLGCSTPHLLPCGIPTSLGCPCRADKRIGVQSSDHPNGFSNHNISKPCCENVAYWPSAFGWTPRYATVSALFSLTCSEREIYNPRHVLNNCSSRPGLL
jgi:hypothetical protein